MRQILLYIVLVFLPLGIWGQTTSASFECEGCDEQDWAEELTNLGYLDLSDVESITISDASYPNIEYIGIGAPKKISLVLKTEEDGSETTPYEVTDILQAGIAGFNAREGHASATIHYITADNCEAAMMMLREESRTHARSAMDDYREDIYIIDLAGDGTYVQVFTLFSFSDAFRSNFQNVEVRRAFRNAGSIGEWTRQLLFNGFKKGVAAVSSKNPWAVALNVAASYGIGGAIERWVGDHADYPTAFYENMLKEGFTGFIANVVDAFGEGLTSSIITATISSILKADFNNFDPQKMLLDIAVGTVLNLLTTNKNIERLQGVIGKVRIFTKDLIGNTSLVKAFLENPKLIKAWKEALDGGLEHIRTNTNFLEIVSGYLKTANPTPKIHQNLSLIEEASIRFYTTNPGYKDLNKALRGEITMTPSFQEQADILSMSVSKLPRSIHNSSGKNLWRIENLSTSQFASEYVKGVDVTKSGFFSSTYSEDAIIEATRNRPHNVLVRIEGKNGKLIEDVSTLPSEKEILFNKNTKFEVVDVGFSPHPDFDQFPGSPIQTVWLKEK